jgi:cellulose synthase/poly-beta-1,6-N-acetylglucosamine synthase-like glycosyltransferase
VKYYDTHWFTRTMEILPGAVTWMTLILPILLSLWLPVWVAYFIIAYDLYWVAKSFRLSVNLIRGYSRLHKAQKIDWDARIAELGTGSATVLDPHQIYHAVIMATYNESMDILYPSVSSLTDVDFPLDHLMLVIAYEERGGAETEANARKLVADFGDKFALAIAVKHPDGIVGEVRGKGGNIR